MGASSGSPADSVGAVVLAAGEGRRMGRPKATLRVGGSLLCRRVVGELLAGGCRPVVLVLGAGASLIEEELGDLEATVLVHDGWALGQTGSLQAGLRALVGPPLAFLVQPVDHAGVTAPVVSELIAEWNRSSDPGRAIVRPRVLGRGCHPVLFGDSHLWEFLALGKDEPAHAVYRAHQDRVRWIDCDDPLLLVDLDTPADLESFAEAISGRERPTRRSRDVRPEGA